MSVVLEAVAARSRRDPDGAALTAGHGRVLSNAALWRSVEDVAATISRLPGGRSPVAVCLDNAPEWVVLDLALALAGRAAVPLPPFFTDAQRGYALRQAGVRLMVGPHRDPAFAPAGPLAIAGATLPLQEAVGDAVPAVPGLPEGTAKVTFTSGTTGEPKGVCLSQAAMERVAAALVEAIGAQHAGTHCAVLPLSILLENVAGLYPTLIAGGRYHVPPPAGLGLARTFAPDFAALARALRECAATSAILVPELLRGLVAAIGAGAPRLPAMRLLAVGGGRVSSDLLAEAAAMGLPVRQGYGLSEAGSVVALNTPAADRPGSVGRPLPGVTISIADDGEVLIEDPAYLGYVGGPARTPVLATGDIGWIDADGWLHVDGRRSHVIVTAFGRNVAPEWVESEILAEPGIAQALVFGDGAPSLGALVVPATPEMAGPALDRALLRANRRLPVYARVRHWARVPPFTAGNGHATGNGRIRRDAIHRDHGLLMLGCLAGEGRYVSFFERLAAATAADRTLLQETPQIRDGLAGRISRRTYLDYLAEAYHHVKHTVALLQLARARLPAEKAWLREALDRYAAEEAGHEEWILDDIAQAGGDAAAVRAGSPRLATELMVAYAYDYVGRVNPVGIFGMVFVLEGTSTQLAVRGANALMGSLGLPPACFRYLLSHGAVDVDHMQFLEGLLNRIRDPADEAAVVHMAKAMFRLFAEVFRSIPHGGVTDGAEGTHAA